jgi:hypothetical protein
LFFHLQQQRLIEYIREGRVTDALEFAQEELAPRGEENVSGFHFFFHENHQSLFEEIVYGCDKYITDMI